jgi:uncharacterized membrane protein (DUF106 family)
MLHNVGVAFRPLINCIVPSILVWASMIEVVVKSYPAIFC